MLIPIFTTKKNCELVDIANTELNSIRTPYLTRMAKNVQIRTYIFYLILFAEQLLFSPPDCEIRRKLNTLPAKSDKLTVSRVHYRFFWVQNHIERRFLILMRHISGKYEILQLMCLALVNRKDFSSRCIFWLPRLESCL